MLKIKKLHKKYGETVIFSDFNITFKKNKINCVLGKSGCGKTTLLNIIAGLDTEFKGNIDDYKKMTFSYIFQEPRLLEWYTIEKNMFLALKNKENPNELVKKYLELVELYEYKDYYPNQLSGGMKQRVSIARAFAYESDILLMDEPFKGLDPSIKSNLIKWFIKLWEKDKRTIIFVTHEISETVLLGDEIHILDKKPLEEIFHTRIDTDKKDRRISDEYLKEIEQKILDVFMEN